MSSEIIPKKIFRSAPQELSIEWSDSHLSKFNFIDLRDNCPCANCIDEWTREKTLDRNQIPQNLDLVKLTTVGRYAIQFIWSDQHQTGIYPYALLKEIDNS